MKKLLLITVLMLSGCFSSVTKEELELCLQSCRPNQGVRRITPNLFLSKCYCENGAQFKVIAK